MKCRKQVVIKKRKWFQKIKLQSERSGLKKMKNETSFGKKVCGEGLRKQSLKREESRIFFRW